MKLKPWLEAMRLRTLPVSVAGVFMAAGCALASRTFQAAPVALCMLFAILAQISSNFANEYYDFKSGLDKKGREGPRRGVTEGDISPRAMLYATYGTLVAACCVGLSLLVYGGWWLIPIGIGVALGVVAYSTGPYPLSHHGLGEVAVVFFFGIVPVCCTYVLQGGEMGWPITFAGLSAGLMGANVLIVNNYRDEPDDRAVGKRTIAVIFGRKAVRWLYIVNAVVAVLLMGGWFRLTWSSAMQVVWVAYLCGSLGVFGALKRNEGRKLNPQLGITAQLMLLFCGAWAVIAAIY